LPTGGPSWGAPLSTTVLHPRSAWKHIFEPVIRHSAGLGKAPTQNDADRYEYFYAYVDVLIIGGGVAGLAAALEAGRTGAKVLVIEQTQDWGGRARTDEMMIGDETGPEWIASTLKALQEMENVDLRTRMMGAGVYDHGYITAYERITDHAPSDDLPRHRLWRIRAKRTITATGALERPLAFAGNDVPGVISVPKPEKERCSKIFRVIAWPCRGGGLRWCISGPTAGGS